MAAASTINSFFSPKSSMTTTPAPVTITKTEKKPKTLENEEGEIVQPLQPEQETFNGKKKTRKPVSVEEEEEDDDVYDSMDSEATPPTDDPLDSSFHSEDA